MPKPNIFGETGVRRPTHHDSVVGMSNGDITVYTTAKVTGLPARVLSGNHMALLDDDVTIHPYVSYLGVVCSHCGQKGFVNTSAFLNKGSGYCTGSQCRDAGRKEMQARTRANTGITEPEQWPLVRDEVLEAIIAAKPEVMWDRLHPNIKAKRLFQLLNLYDFLKEPVREAGISIITPIGAPDEMLKQSRKAAREVRQTRYNHERMLD